MLIKNQFIHTLLAIFLSFLPGLSNSLTVQDSEQKDLLWSVVENQLERQKSDTSFHFILVLVRGHCGSDLDCMYSTYRTFRRKLETRFNLRAAIYLSKEMVKIAVRKKDLNAEAHAYLNLYRFHDALGDAPRAAIDLENAKNLFERVGDKGSVIYVKRSKIEHSLSYRSIDEVLPEMNALLEDAEQLNDTLSMLGIHHRLISMTLSANLLESTALHISETEKLMTVSEPIKLEEYGYLILVAIGKANLALAKDDFVNGEKHFLEALRLCEAEPSRWLEIDVLISLANLDFKRKNIGSAKAYLDRARTKASGLELDELLTRIYDSKQMIAEYENRPADALSFMKSSIFHKEKFKSKSTGFDPRAFYLQLEKDQLSSERARQEVALELKETELRNSFAIIGFILLLSFVLFFVSVSQRRSGEKLEEQNLLIKKQSEELQNLDAAKSKFFANVSHELRTPLTLLLGPISSLLKENRLTDRQAKLLKMASQSGDQLQRLVNEILDLSKLEASKMTMDLEPTKVVPFFRQYLMQFESLGSKKNIEFEANLVVNTGLIVEIDRAKCRQILYNLLSNAFKFTPEGGKITVDLTIENEQLKLVVADSGFGIHPNDLPRLFDRYFQSGQPGKSINGGTGIGLALCKEYVNLFGGVINVESKEGKGSIFKIEFPVSISGRRQTGGEEFIPKPSKSITDNEIGGSSMLIPLDKKSKSTILLVEDNPELQEYIGLILEEKYHVVKVDNGQEALNYKPGLDKVSLILSDLMMPVMDGYELLQNLKSSDATRHIPFVMLTARADAKDKLKALRLGVDDYLLKPFEEDELKVRIANLLKNYEVRKAVREEGIDVELTNIKKYSNDLVNPVAPKDDSPSEPSNLNLRPKISAEENEWLQKLEATVEKELPSLEFNLDRLSTLMFVSRRQLGRQIKTLVGLTPSEYLLEARLQAARRMLDENKVKTVKELTYSVGLKEAKHFSKQFKKRFGKSPAAMIQSG